MIPFIFPPGEDARALVAQLQANGWLGQIIGPHGSGKSSLVASLIPAIEQAGRHAVLMELHDRQRRLPMDAALQAELGRRAVLIVDGYEQLSILSRLRLRWLRRRKRVGLVVTAHASVGLPTLHRTVSNLESAREIISQLLRDDPTRFTPEEIESAFVRHGGNLRECLFDLYDLYEARRAEPEGDLKNCPLSPKAGKTGPLSAN
jgi:hypothetical protein